MWCVGSPDKRSLHSKACFIGVYEKLGQENSSYKALLCGTGAQEVIICHLVSVLNSNLCPEDPSVKRRQRLKQQVRKRANPVGHWQKHITAHEVWFYYFLCLSFCLKFSCNNKINCIVCHGFLVNPFRVLVINTLFYILMLIHHI